MKLSEIKTIETMSLKDRIRELVRQELQRAKKIWAEVGDELVKAESRALLEKMQTDIAGYSVIDPSKSAVDQFIAVVVDMRDSTNHLMHSISNTKVICLERVYYETSALLPAVAEVMHEYGGRVSEYLGDGVLAFFRYGQSKNDDCCRQARRAAKYILGDMCAIVNDELQSWFDLPPIDLGIGMALSKAVVTVVGHPEQRRAKVIGECVFRASKIALLKNGIAVDKLLKEFWPSSAHGKVIFKPLKDSGRGFDAYQLST